MRLVELLYRWKKNTISDTGKFEKETKINAFPEILVLQLGMITEVNIRLLD